MKYRLIDAINRISDDDILCYDPLANHLESTEIPSISARRRFWRLALMAAAAILVIIFSNDLLKLTRFKDSGMEDGDYLVETGSAGETVYVSSETISNSTVYSDTSVMLDVDFSAVELSEPPAIIEWFMKNGIETEGIFIGDYPVSLKAVGDVPVYSDNGDTKPIAYLKENDTFMITASDCLAWIRISDKNANISGWVCLSDRNWIVAEWQVRILQTE